jgi:hypothetical protein
MLCVVGAFFYALTAVSLGWVSRSGRSNLKGLDLYKRLSVGENHGDGLVAVHSQLYPN